MKRVPKRSLYDKTRYYSIPEFKKKVPTRPPPLRNFITSLAIYRRMGAPDAKARDRRKSAAASSSSPSSSSSRSRLTCWFLLLVSVSAVSCCVLVIRTTALLPPRGDRHPRQQEEGVRSPLVNLTSALSEWAPAEQDLSHDSEPPAAAGPRDGIPRIIHQSWKSRDRIPSRFAPWMRSWIKLHPGWTYVFWTDVDNLAIFERRYPQFLSVARAVSKISLADMARYALLHSVGGLYVDVDFECTRPLDTLHNTHKLFLGSEPLAHAVLLEKSTTPALCNAIMASTPGHPFWLSVLDNIKEKFKRRGQRGANAFDAVGLTGPRVVKQTYFENASYVADQTLAVLAPEFFYPEVAYWNLGEMEKACKRSQRLGGGTSELKAAAAQACAWLSAFPNGEFTSNTHATHHWQCTWCRGERSPEYLTLDAILQPELSSSALVARVARPVISEDTVELLETT